MADIATLTKAFKKTFENRGHALRWNNLSNLWLLPKMMQCKRNGKHFAER